MSKGPLDALGNELLEGQWVLIKHQGATLIGKIANLNLGGIALPTGGSPNGKITPGTFLVNIQMPAIFEPGVRIADIFRVVDPTSQAIVEKALDDDKGSKLHTV